MNAFLPRARAYAAKRAHRLLARLASWRSRALLRSTQHRAADGARPETIGIGLVEHMGDIVAAEPLLRSVRAKHPQAHIVWCVRAPFRALVESHPAVDRALVVTCLTEWIHLRFGGAFDRVYDLHVQARACPVCRLPLHRPEGNPAITQANYFDHGNLLQVMAQHADLAVGDDRPVLHVPPAAAARVAALGLPPAYVVLHCASNEKARDWSPEHWNALVASLGASADASPAICTVEVGLQPIVATSLPTHTDLCGRIDLLEMAAVIANAALFVGIDSGPAHIANAVGTRGLVLLGPYRGFARYMPFSGGYADGSHAEILFEPDGLAMLPAERVAAAIRDRIAGTAMAEASRPAEGSRPLGSAPSRAVARTCRGTRRHRPARSGR